VKLGPLGELPIRDLRLDVEEERARHDRMVDLVAAMLGLKHQLAGARDGGSLSSRSFRAELEARIDELDRRIDSEVFRLYDLTEGEITSVETTVGALAPPP
jgi:hypothetical protein